MRAELVSLGIAMASVANRFATAHELHSTDVRALWILAEPNVSFTSGELATHLGLSNAAATRTIDRLEQLGFVKRARDPKDRRRVIVQFTEQASTTTDIFFGQLANAVERSIEQLTETESRAVASFIRTASESLRAWNDMPASR